VAFRTIQRTWIECLVVGNIFESIPRPIPSHRASAFYPFFRQGNEPVAKGLPSEGWLFAWIGNPQWGWNICRKIGLFNGEPLAGVKYFSENPY